MSDPGCDDARMETNRVRDYELGDVVEVKPVSGGYPLPDGLPEGAQVRVIRMTPGWCSVERDGREWEVFTGCVVPRRTHRVRPTLAPRPCGRGRSGASVRR
jgi:hypothetical protein